MQRSSFYIQGKKLSLEFMTEKEVDSRTSEKEKKSRCKNSREVDGSLTTRQAKESMIYSRKERKLIKEFNRFPLVSRWTSSASVATWTLDGMEKNERKESLSGSITSLDTVRILQYVHVIVFALSLSFDLDLYHVADPVSCELSHVLDYCMKRILFKSQMRGKWGGVFYLQSRIFDGVKQIYILGKRPNIPSFQLDITNQFNDEYIDIFTCALRLKSNGVILLKPH